MIMIMMISIDDTNDDNVQDEENEDNARIERVIMI